jgi:hypothetical protein
VLLLGVSFFKYRKFLFLPLKLLVPRAQDIYEEFWIVFLVEDVKVVKLQILPEFLSIQWLLDD